MNAEKARQYIKKAVSEALNPRSLIPTDITQIVVNRMELDDMNCKDRSIIKQVCRKMIDDRENFEIEQPLRELALEILENQKIQTELLKSMELSNRKIVTKFDSKEFINRSIVDIINEISSEYINLVGYSPSEIVVVARSKPNNGLSYREVSMRLR